MPKLQGFRLVNVRANENNIVYPDVYFPVYGKNTLLDMRNGGGKTLAVQMLFQTIIPNSYFSNKNPISGLFQNVRMGTTMHVAAHFSVEHVQFKDLVLGFCACSVPRLTEDGEEGEMGLKYLNYIIAGDNLDKDNLCVQTLPLSLLDGTNRKTLSYEELKQYLRNKSGNPKNGQSYYIQIYESKKTQYMTELRKYGINREVFDLLMEINKDENYIKQFFEENCKTPRELLTEFIIPQTEKALAAKSYLPGEKQEDIAYNLAESLFNKAKNLNELNVFLKDREQYSQLIENINSLNLFMEARKESLGKFTTHLLQYPKQYALIYYLLFEVERKKNELEEKKLDTENQITECQHRIANAEIRINELNMQNAETEYKNAEKQLDEKEKEKERHKLKLYRYNAENCIIEYREYEGKYKALSEKLEKLTAPYYDEKVKLSSYANRIEEISNEKINKLDNDKTKQEKKQSIAHEKVETTLENLGRYSSKAETAQNSIEQFTKQREELETERAELLMELDDRHSLFHDEELKEFKRLMEEGNNRLIEIEKSKENLLEEKHKNEIIIAKAKENDKHLKQQADENEKLVTKYRTALQQAESAAGCSESRLEAAVVELEEQYNEKYLHQKDIARQIEKYEDEIEVLRTFGFIRKRSAYDAIYQLKGEWQYVRFGSDLLMEMDEKIKSDYLERFPWICEVVIVADADYNGLVTGKKKVHFSVAKENLVFMPRSAFENPEKICLEQLFLLTPEGKYYNELLDVPKAISQQEEVIKKHESACEKAKRDLQQILERLKEVRYFIVNYLPDTGKQYLIVQDDLKQKRKTVADTLRTIGYAIEKNCLDMDILMDEQSQVADALTDYQAKIDILTKIIDINAKITDQKELIKQMKEEHEDLLKEVDNLNYDMDSYKQDEKMAKLEIENFQLAVNTYKNYLKDVKPFTNKECGYAPSDDITVLVAQFQMIKKPFDANKENLDEIIEEQNDLNNNMNKRKESYHVRFFDFDILYKETQEKRHNNEELKTLDEVINRLEEEKSRINNILYDKKMVFTKAEKQYNESLRRKNNYYPEFQNMGLSKAKEMLGILWQEEDELNRMLLDITGTLKQAEKEMGIYKTEGSSYKSFCDGKGLQCDNAEQAIEYLSYDTVHKDYDRLEQAYNRNIKDINQQIFAFKGFIEKMETSNSQFKKALLDRIDRVDDYKAIKDLGQTLAHTAENIKRIIENIDISIENVGKLDEEIAYQIYRMLSNVLDEAAKIPEYSKFKYETSYKEFIQINLTEDGCRYKEDDAIRRIKSYVYDLAAKTEEEDFQIKDIKNALSIKKLLPFGVDINQLSIRILKMQNEKAKYYVWGSLRASSGQGYVTYVMFTVTMIKYFNNVSQNLHKNKSPIFIFLDNPFASASAFELWEPVRQFLNKSNAQLLCAAHNPPSPAQILFDNEIIIEQFKNEKGQFINKIRNQKIESKEMINITLFDNYTVE